MGEERNIKIEGMGTCYGGTYNNVNLEGMTSIKEDIKCNFFSAEGMCKCEGNIEADKFIAEGTFKGIKNIKAKDFRAEGLFRAKKSTVSADVVNVEGIITCDELSADSIYIDGFCRVEKIFGDVIRINPAANIKRGFNLFFKQTDMSKAGLIECTQIEAAYLEAETIRANRISLGKNCVVGLVEYSEEIEIHPEAKVRELVKL